MVGRPGESSGNVRGVLVGCMKRADQSFLFLGVANTGTDRGGGVLSLRP